MKMKNFKRTKGITLIALVITIIILIILAGVSISLIIDNNGIASKAKEGAESYKESSAKERVELLIYDYKMDTIDKTTTFKDRMESKGAENFEEVSDYYILDMNGYSFTIDKETLKIVEMQQAITRPEVSNVTLRLESNPSQEPAANSLNEGDKIIINFDANLVGGQITNISPAVPYTTNGIERKITFNVNGIIDGKSTKRIVTIDTSDKYKVDITISLSNESLTKDPITATVNWTGVPESYTKEISVNNGSSYEPYTGPKQITRNGTIIARAKSGATIYTSDPKTVNCIDGLAPEAFNAVLEETANDKIKITAKTTDKVDNTGANLTSGLTGYIYYINDGTNTTNSGLTTNEYYEATGLSLGTTYTVYVEAYDAAGNMTRSTNTPSCTKQQVYTWEKYTTTTGKVWEYYLAASNKSESSSYPSWPCPSFSSLESTFNTSNGKWMRDGTCAPNSFSVGTIINFALQQGNSSTALDASKME